MEESTMPTAALGDIMTMYASELRNRWMMPILFLSTGIA
jgi:hypothetical protein